MIEAKFLPMIETKIVEMKFSRVGICPSKSPDKDGQIAIVKFNNFLS